MNQVYLQGLGFENVPKATETETFDALYEQVEDAPNIADAVLEELKDRTDPDPVHKDNYDEVLQDWIADQVCLLHQERRGEPPS